MTLQHTEVAVVGGGMVGGALALGLAQQGFEVTVIEQAAPPAYDPASKPDVRISAISAASVDLLRGLGVWEAVQAMRAHPYSRLETWEWENAHVAFDAAELKLPRLGYMVENNVLQRALWQALEANPKVTLRVPASLKALHPHERGYLLTLDNGDELAVKLVIGADGANSQVRQMAGIGVHAWQYEQSCMLITAECENAPGESTWQHFTPNGPHAFLPLFDNWASLVWYDKPARIRQLQGMNMEQLQREILLHFPSRLGHVTPVAAGAFPLTRRHALQYARAGLALVGDAAHTIHPLAGQGVNLGFMDAAELVEELRRLHREGKDIGQHLYLRRYERSRKHSAAMMLAGMQGFRELFAGSNPAKKLLRDIGLKLADTLPGVKPQLLRQAMGLNDLPDWLR